MEQLSEFLAAREIPNSEMNSSMPDRFRFYTHPNNGGICIYFILRRLLPRYLSNYVQTVPHFNAEDEDDILWYISCPSVRTSRNAGRSFSLRLKVE